MLDRLVGRDIKYITFRDSYGAYDRTYYLQQRWNSTEIDDPLKLLSSGEMRKYQITKMLNTNPTFLIIDNPYIGLDAETRTKLTELLTELARDNARRIVLVLTKEEEVPPFITDVWRTEATAQEPLMEITPEGLDSAPACRRWAKADYASEIVAEMRNVTIRYGERTILKDLNWTVRNGECWALSGQNGSGKSTLLSLICADNPQSYACDITLFDRKRGSGETIWDIKKHIGYMSPEMHRAYHRDIDAIKIVASGLNDTIGLYVKPKEEEMDTCRFWMRVFGIEGLADRSFVKMSSGEQRLVLLARAFVKDPELLILDEPLHGLDHRNGKRVKDIINAFCARENKTLIMVSHYREEYPECITKYKEIRKTE